MPVSLTDIAGGFLAPAICAGVVVVVLNWLLPDSLARRLAATTALVGGFTLGYALLGLGQWSPRFFWHWLPYVVLMALPVGPLLAGAGKQRVVGVVLMLCVAIVGGWLLVPTWPHLEPPRAVYMFVWIPAICVLAFSLDPLTRSRMEDELPRNNLPKGLLVGTLTASMFLAVIIIFLSGSLRFTQLAGAGAAAMLGIAMAVVISRKKYGVDGIAPAFSLLIGGLLLIAFVDSHSSVPLLSYVLVALAPLALWIAAVKLLRKFSGWRLWLVLMPLPLGMLLAALILAIVAEFGSTDSY